MGKGRQRDSLVPAPGHPGDGAGIPPDHVPFPIPLLPSPGAASAFSRSPATNSHPYASL